MSRSHADQIASIVQVAELLSREDQERICSLALLIGRAPPRVGANAEHMIWNAVAETTSSGKDYAREVDAIIGYLEDNLRGLIPNNRRDN